MTAAMIHDMLRDTYSHARTAAKLTHGIYENIADDLGGPFMYHLACCPRRLRNDAPLDGNILG